MDYLGASFILVKFSLVAVFAWYSMRSLDKRIERHRSRDAMTKQKTTVTKDEKRAK